jgi:hypothetical protein
VRAAILEESTFLINPPSPPSPFPPLLPFLFPVRPPMMQDVATATKASVFAEGTEDSEPDCYVEVKAEGSVYGTEYARVGVRGQYAQITFAQPLLQHDADLTPLHHHVRCMFPAEHQGFQPACAAG